MKLFFRKIIPYFAPLLFVTTLFSNNSLQSKCKLHPSFLKHPLGNQPFIKQLFGKDTSVSDPDKILLQVLEESSNQLCRKYDFIPYGIGMAGKFEHLSIDFKVYRPLTKQQARALLIDCIDLFLDKINSSQELRPYLKPCPFTRKNVGMTLFIFAPEEEPVFHPEIAIARWSSEGVHFRTKDPEKQYGYKETINETHEEALALAEQYRAESQKDLTSTK